MKFLPVLLLAAILQCFWPGPVTEPTVLKVETCTLPEPFKFGTVIREGGNALLIGNEYGNGFFGQYRRTIDLSNCQQVGLSQLAYNTAHHDSVKLGDKYITVGGMVRNSSGVVFSSPWMQYDNNSVAPTGYYPGVHDPEVVKISDTEAIAIGGWEWSQTSAQVFKFNSALTKSVIGNLATARSYRTAHLMTDGSVYIIGGLYYTGAVIQNLASIETVAPSGQISTKSYSLTTGRRYHNSVAIGSKIYVIGGSNIPTLGRGAGLSSIEVIDTVAGTVTSHAPLNYPRQHSQTLHLQRAGKDYIVVFGGEHNNQPVPQAELIDIAAGTVSVLNGISWGLTDHDRIHACSGNTVWLAGGEDITSNSGTNQLYTITFDPDTTCVE